MAAYTYDALSRRTRVDLGNGASTAYTYNLSDTVSRIEHAWHLDSATLDYTYDRSDLVTSLTTSDARFKPWFGPAGETDFTPNNLNQYTQAGSTTLTYSTAGNLAGDGTRTFGYDSLNRLKTFSASGPATNYYYDPLGRRIGKVLMDITETATHYLYAGDRIIAEYDLASGELKRRYIYGPGIDEPVAMVAVNQGAETTYYYHADRLGSVIGLTNSNGDLVESYHYTPYGQPYKASVIGNPFLYTGREYDVESGLYHYRARAYDPILRRFLQPDPIGFADSMNLYAYVNNGPLNAVDPFGLIINVVSGSYHDEDFLQNYQTAREYLCRDTGMAGIIDKLEKSSVVYTIHVNSWGRNYYDPKMHEIYWNPTEASKLRNGGTRSPALRLGHELAHAEGFSWWRFHIPTFDNYDNFEEKRVITGPESAAARTLEEGIRNDHHDGNETYYVRSPILR